ncbi:MAG: tripartite tricarboxylate transporter permease [Spirochaetales bacterium]|jgi:putative tricarboxylic transport membrane protein|nr:tripartite tricarboxylate transporter permease [Spirochaetales bacterium]
MVISGLLSVCTPFTITLIFFGVVLGIIFGAIPGMSATMAVALCLPISFGLHPVQGISLLLGLYIGGISGGLISAILLKIPGTPSSIATCFDGNPMANRGEAGKALGVGILYSFLGGLLSFLALIFIAPPIASFSLKFSPVEYFSVTVFSLTMIASLSEGSLIKGLMSGAFGLGLSLYGSAPLDGYKRFTFGLWQLDLGFALLSVLIGFYAISEIIETAGNKYKVTKSNTIQFTLKGFGVSWKEFCGQLWNFFRSTIIGIGIGILPGIGGGTSNIISYVTAKSQSKYPEKFGTGIIDGVIASEAANNATIGGALIPLLTLGIPGDSVTAMLLGGLMVHGIIPGPMLFATNGELIYAIFAALIIANIIMLIVEFFGIRIFVRLLQIPKSILLSVIVCLCVVGAFAGNNRVFDVWAMGIFGALGFIMLKIKMPLPPVILGFILGPILESNMRRGLQLHHGDWIPFFTRPISGVFLAIAALSIIMTAIKEIRRKMRIKQPASLQG